MRSWLYRHPTIAFLLSAIGFLICAGLAFDTLLDDDGWWRLFALGWAYWAWRCAEATDRHWRRS